MVELARDSTIADFHGRWRSLAKRQLIFHLSHKATDYMKHCDLRLFTHQRSKLYKLLRSEVISRWSSDTLAAADLPTWGQQLVKLKWGADLFEHRTDEGGCYAWEERTDGHTAASGVTFFRLWTDPLSETQVLFSNLHDAVWTEFYLLLGRYTLASGYVNHCGSRRMRILLGWLVFD